MTTSRNNMSRSFIILMLAMDPLLTLAQKSSKVTGNFSDTPFASFVSTIESQTDFHFYFNPQWTDSVKVTLSADNQDLGTVLKSALSSTELHYAIHGNAVYITKE